MDVTRDLSFIHLIQNASLLVQLVMGLLLLVSLMSWWYIFLKMFSIRQAISQSKDFEEAFWEYSDLNKLQQDVSGEPDDAGSMGRIFLAGFTEFIKLRKKTGITTNSTW